MVLILMIQIRYKYRFKNHKSSCIALESAALMLEATAALRRTCPKSEVFNLRFCFSELINLSKNKIRSAVSLHSESISPLSVLALEIIRAKYYGHNICQYMVQLPEILPGEVGTYSLIILVVEYFMTYS
ncbi:unnamed protein product [Leptidea sinapis]|uniref:Uncharacterized protein n=1 Tax=Leptidea sinapis TaxID=189913 RepID=A0A5E4PZR8_9NEOP|nr:unnamed protein product [Leptidea sinapis]